MVQDVTDLPGLDLTALAGWLDRERPGLRSGELTATLITGGRSNLTYRVGDGTTSWAVRRPPLGHVLPTEDRLDEASHATFEYTDLGMSAQPAARPTTCAA